MLLAERPRRPLSASAGVPRLQLLSEAKPLQRAAPAARTRRTSAGRRPVQERSGAPNLVLAWAPFATPSLCASARAYGAGRLVRTRQAAAKRERLHRAAASVASREPTGRSGEIKAAVSTFLLIKRRHTQRHRAGPLWSPESAQRRQPRCGPRFPGLNLAARVPASPAWLDIERAPNGSAISYDTGAGNRRLWIARAFLAHAQMRPSLDGRRLAVYTQPCS